MAELASTAIGANYKISAGRESMVMSPLGLGVFARPVRTKWKGINVKNLALFAAGAASLALATPAQAATVLYTSGQEVGLIGMGGIFSGAFEANVVTDAASDPNFTADFFFITPAQGNAIASAISIALNAASNLDFTSISINGTTGSVVNGQLDRAFTNTVLVTGGRNELRITGLLNSPSGQGNAGFGGNVTFAEQAAVVPEPATWAMLILAFGTLGLGMRRRNAQVTTTKARLTFA